MNDTGSRTSRGFGVQSPAAMLGDLIATHESQRHPAAARPAGPADTAHPEPVGGRPGQRSLFGEILDFMLAPLLLLWPLTIIITLVVARSLADAPYDNALVDRARLLSQQVRLVMTTGVSVPPSSESAPDLFAREESLLAYQVMAPDGQLLFGDPALPGPARDDNPEAGAVQLRNARYRDADLRIAYTYIPMRGDPDLARPVLIQVAEPIDERQDLANRIIKGVIFPQFIVLPVAAALVWFGLSRGLRPMRGLRDRIRRRKPDDLSPIDPGRAPEELRPLVDAFNELLARLQATLATQKRFIADAAHQMKTPLAGIRMQAEMVLREQGPAERERSLQQLAHSSERASHLINQLLALARAESLGDKREFVPLRLNTLLRETVAELAPLALAARLDLGLDDAAGPVRVAGNPVLLGELLHNLVGNAIHYTPAHGVVNVRLRTGMDVATIEIEDNGPGVPPAEREAVFERFYRVRDREASDVGDTHGSGLGLAIVREIARLHDAQIVITDGAAWPPARGRGVGACFVLRIPALPDDTVR